MNVVNIYALAYVLVRKYPVVRLRRIIERFAVTLWVGMAQLDEAAKGAASAMNDLARAFERADMAETAEFLAIMPDDENDDA